MITAWKLFWFRDNESFSFNTNWELPMSPPTLAFWLKGSQQSPLRSLERKKKKTVQHLYNWFRRLKFTLHFEVGLLSVLSNSHVLSQRPFVVSSISLA